MTRAISYARNSSKKQRSIEGQADENRAECARHGWILVDELADGTSASRYARKPRENWADLLSRLATVDVVVLWEASRGDRTLATWVAFLDACREHGVRIHATGHGTTYDPRKPRDYRSLAEDGVDAHYESDKTSLRLLRGFASQAANGRPHSHVTYGYERVYDPQTRALVEQRPHPDQADVVREIVRRIGQGDAVSAVASDLTRRGVPSPMGQPKWPAQTVSSIAQNRAYLGIRVHRSKTGQVTEHPALWPAIITEAEHYAAVRVLTDPARKPPTRPRNGKATSLLGNLAICGTCGVPMASKRAGGRWVYRHCPTVDAVELDDLVTKVILARLADPEVYGELRHLSDDDDRVAVEAAAEADRLNAELEKWRASAIAGETSPASLAAIEAGLTARINDARRRAQRASAPPQLRALLEAEGDLQARWDAAPLGARRDIVRALVRVVVLRSSGRGQPLVERVVIDWQ